MNNDELRLALDLLEKEKGISKQAIIEAIELSLQTACKNHFGSADNVRVSMNPETAAFSLFAEKTVVEVVGNPSTEISLEDAKAVVMLWEKLFRYQLIPSPLAVLPRRMQRVLSYRRFVKRKERFSLKSITPWQSRWYPVW